MLVCENHRDKAWPDECDCGPGMSQPVIWHFSVPVSGGVIHAVVAAADRREAMERLRADDPCWSRHDVYFHESSSDRVVFCFDAQPDLRMNATNG